MRQASFGFLKDYKKEFGGSLLEGKRKSQRPLSTKHPTHLVLKSYGNAYFNPGNRKIQELIQRQSKKYGIKLYDSSLNWSHIHLLILIPSRKAYKAFIRTLTALLVRSISKAKGKSLKGLFDLRPFTKVLSWGRQFKKVIEYHTLNDLEAHGLITRKKAAPKQAFCIYAHNLGKIPKGPEK